jgi:hypothetical protein
MPCRDAIPHLRAATLLGVYHLEVRQFPRNLCRYNLSSQELRAILHAWARDEHVELGERSWDTRRARITIIDGPRVPNELLTMGRGWRHAQRHGADVTARMLLDARSRAGAGDRAPDAGSAQPLLDELLDLAALLGPEPRRLLAAWRSSSARLPGRSPSECLAQAERELASQPPPGSSADG